MGDKVTPMPHPVARLERLATQTFKRLQEEVAARHRAQADFAEKPNVSRQQALELAKLHERRARAAWRECEDKLAAARTGAAVA